MVTDDHDEAVAHDTSSKPSLLRAYSIAFLVFIIGLGFALVLDAYSQVSVYALAGTVAISVPAMILRFSGAFGRAPAKSTAFLAALVAGMMIVETIVFR